MTNEEIVFFTALMGMFSGIITFSIRGLLKSNCVHLKCGCIECNRETAENTKDLEISSTI